ncbi:MAG: HEAT repeat domain-containing protein [Planctomycetota bacterium]|nr:HEAT repeat domain-containing protein [Planctomycetota bacterium]MDP6990952.1 HEAT repeat domain-containing protein [Planctomycetota bacterium]
MRVPLLPLALGAVCLLAPTPAAQSAKDAYRAIEESKQSIDPRLFKQLTAYGDEESLKLISRTLNLFQAEGTLRQVCLAFESYRGGALEGEAIAFLAKEAGSGRAERRRAAAAGLARFADAARKELGRLVDKSKDEIVRARAVGPLMARLAEEGSPAGLEAILDNARFGLSGKREKIIGHLSSFVGAENEQLLFDRLGDKKYPDLMKVAIVGAIAGRESIGIAQALLVGLKNSGPTVQFVCIEALDARESTLHVKELGKLVKAPDRALRRLAVTSLSRLMGADPAWVKKLTSMAKHKDAATRQGAAVALASLRTPAALEILYEQLLVDPARAVRTEALQEIANLRRKDSIAPLIARIAAETGRLRQDVLTGLRLITGEDLGTTGERWRRWWTNEEAGFFVPPYAEALAKEKARVKKKGEGITRTAFFGLEVASDRVCFVLDVSGSMKGERMGRAKEELSRFVAAYPAEDLFNILFFSTDVYPWQDELVEMSEKTRAEAEKYVARQKADGSTAVYDALELAFEDERVDTIVLLTDGNPQQGTIDDPAEIRAEIKRWNSARHVRIHCVSLNGEPPLLRQLAADSGGTFRVAN